MSPDSPCGSKNQSNLLLIKLGNDIQHETMHTPYSPCSSKKLQSPRFYT